MIAKGKIRADGGKLARYLMTGEPGEIAQLIEARGLEAFGGEPVAAFAAMEDFAQAHTNCKMPFFHGHIRLAPGERLDDDLWKESVDRMEKRLGFTGQPRLVSFHIDQASGEKHLHVAWFRIDMENERAIDPGMYKNHLVQLSRKLEKEFALREISSQRKPEHRAPAADRQEFEESRRLGTDIKKIRTAILDCYEHSDSGKAFKAALDAKGLVLANGDRHDCFVVIDAEGGQHALNKKLTGQTLAAIRDRLADLDRSQLPGVEQAQAVQREIAPEIAQDSRQQPERRAGLESRPAAAQGPYSELRQAQTASQFAAQADRTTEPVAPVWDRDADNSAWEARLADAAERAISAAPEAHQQAKGERDGPSAEGRYAPLQTPEPPAKPKPERELRGTAADIRLVWSLSRTASDLEAGLEARGIGLAEVSRDEAYASERRAALAKEAGKFAPVWREGEIMAVDGRGHAYRLDARTTGQQRGEIEGRLVGVDRAALMDVAATKDAMRAASRAAWKAERRAERERLRPPSWIESRIRDCATDAPAAVAMDEQGRIASQAEALGDRFRKEDERQLRAATVTGAAAFFARLDDAGVAICRVTGEDAVALAGLRQAENMKGLAAEANRETYSGNRIAEVQPGELAAVTRHGDVYRINPAKLGDAARFIPEQLPGVIVARHRFEAERQDIAAHWKSKRAEIEAGRAAFDDTRAAQQNARRVYRAVDAAIETPAAAAGKAARKGGKAAGIVARVWETAFGLIFGGFMAAPKDTPAQAEQKAKAATNEETLQADAAIAAKAERAARLDALLDQMAHGDEYKRVQDYNRSGGAAYHRPAERGEDYERERER